MLIAALVALVVGAVVEDRVAALVAMAMAVVVIVLAVAAVVVVEVLVVVVVAAAILVVVVVVVFLAVLVVVRHQQVAHLAVLDVPAPAARVEAVFGAGMEAGPCRWGHSSGAPWFNIG